MSSFSVFDNSAVRAGIVGGVIGGLVIVGGMILHHAMKDSDGDDDGDHPKIFFPISLEFVTDGNTHFNVYAYLKSVHRRAAGGRRRIRLVVPRFAMTTSTVVKSAGSVALGVGATFPVNLMPIPSDAIERDALLYSGDTGSTVPGSAMFKGGSVGIVSSVPTAAGKAWGLAKDLSFEFEVSD
jgi:hypothetical protein